MYLTKIYRLALRVYTLVLLSEETRNERFCSLNANEGISSKNNCISRAKIAKILACLSKKYLLYNTHLFFLKNKCVGCCDDNSVYIFVKSLL